jgi:hypothetical protein
MIYLDYSVPIAVLRSKVEEVVAASTLWDHRVANVAVTEGKRDGNPYSRLRVEFWPVV